MFPRDYHSTRALVMEKLGMPKEAFFGNAIRPVLNRVGQMGGRVGQFVSQHAEPLTHATELGGLGVLAVPSAMELAHKRPPATTPEGAEDEKRERFKSKAELAGLGILGAPSALHLADHLRAAPKVLSSIAHR